jgi:hypothetical protein
VEAARNGEKRSGVDIDGFIKTKHIDNHTLGGEMYEPVKCKVWDGGAQYATKFFAAQATKTLKA